MNDHIIFYFCLKLVADCLNSLGITNWKLKRYGDALYYYNRALELFKKKLGENHPNGILF